jgi:UDP-N-acetylglucosamine--N-acetylmuramyl-(pentapeptide) pyrophosphoryl-undecaprenol N-acetylglucosamine transferase
VKAILAGGGTGGHVIPALAIAQELKTQHGAEVLFVGTSRGIENRLVPAAGYKLKLVEIGALKKVSIATRVKTLFDLPRAIARAKQILTEFRPDVVIGVGGYASGPMMLAAVMSDIPTIAFEPNVVPGFANKIVGVMASAAAVQFAETCKYFRRCTVTGVPVRQEFFQVRDGAAQGEPKSSCGLNCPATLLVFGGSQGARAINEAVIGALPQLEARVPNLHIIHQLGEKDYEAAQASYLHCGLSAELSPFITNMADAFRRSDLLVCRSGASTIAEITAAGKPSILVPFPHATDDHQTRNAEALVRVGAAIMIRERDLRPETLFETVTTLLGDRARLQKMSEAAAKLAHPNAASEIARTAARLAVAGQVG